MVQKNRTINVMVSLSLMLLLGSMLVGCYDYKQVRAFTHNPRTSVSGTDYIVYPPDTLLVTSTHIPEINDVAQQVRPDGRINLPLIGELDAAGKTPKQIEAQINQLAKKYYAEVDANIQVVGFNSQKYYIFGEVGKSGPIPWTGHDTLLDALAQAQPTFLGWMERVTVVRGSTPQEGGQEDRKYSLKYHHKGVHPDREDNPPKKLTFNIKAMIKSGDMTNNILLEPNDVIYVQPHPLAAVGLGVQSILLPIRPAAESVEAPAGAVTTVGG